MAVRETTFGRASDRLVQGIFYVFGITLLVAGLFSLLAQGQLGALIGVVGGIALLAVWWFLRPRRRSADARRWQTICSGLSLAIGVGIGLSLLAIGADVSLQTPVPTIVGGVVTLALLTLRIRTGRRLRALVASDNAAEQRGPQSVLRAQVERELDRSLQREIETVTRQVRSGIYPSSPSLVRAPDGVVTLRPDPHRLGLAVSLVALPFVLVLSIRVLLLGWIGLAIIAGAIGGSVGTALLVRRLRIWHGFVRLTPTAVSFRPWYGRLHSVPRTAISRVALVTASLGIRVGEHDVDYLLFLGHDGRCVLCTGCVGIARKDQQAFAVSTGIPIEARSEPLDPADMRREYPGSISWFWSHQLTAALVIVFVIVVLVVAGVIGTAAVSGQPTRGG